MIQQIIINFLMSKFTSRKFLVAISAAAGFAINGQLELAAVVICTWIAGETAVDIAYKLGLAKLPGEPSKQQINIAVDKVNSTPDK